MIIYKKEFYKNGLLEIEISLEKSEFPKKFCVIWRDGKGGLLKCAEYCDNWWVILQKYRDAKDLANQVLPAIGINN